MLFDAGKSKCGINQAKVVCEENKMKYIACNNDKSIVYQYQIDGEIITDINTKRCDYLVENESKKDAYLVELKGCDVSKACEQLLNTLNIFEQILFPYKTHSRIICSRANNNIHDSSYRKLKKKCPDTIIKCKQYEEII